MKNKINLFIVVLLFTICSSLSAQDLTPADVYYRDKVAVNDVSARAPVLRNDDDDNSSPGTGGETDAPWVGGPLEDAVLPIMLVGLVYAGFVLVNRKSKKSA